MDLLFVNELHSNKAFRAALFEHVAGSDLDFLGAWRGVYNSFGETDVLVLGGTSDGKRVAILIENKIDASFQPMQAQRYSVRGEAGIGVAWDKYATCLFAPAAYIESNVAAGDWQSLLTYEEAGAWFGSKIPVTPGLFPEALRGAADKFDKGGFVADRRASQFWAEYEAFCRAEFPHLGMKPLKPRQSRNEPWPRFGTGLLPSDLLLEHKPSHGRIDLTFAGLMPEEVSTRFGALLVGVTPVRAGHSAALRRQVTPIDHLKAFDQQKEAVREALMMASQLLEQAQSILQRKTGELPE